MADVFVVEGWRLIVDGVDGSREVLGGIIDTRGRMLDGFHALVSVTLWTRFSTVLPMHWIALSMTDVVWSMEVRFPSRLDVVWPECSTVWVRELMSQPILPVRSAIVSTRLLTSDVFWLRESTRMLTSDVLWLGVDVAWVRESISETRLLVVLQLCWHGCWRQTFYGWGIRIEGLNIRTSSRDTVLNRVDNRRQACCVWHSHCYWKWYCLRSDVRWSFLFVNCSISVLKSLILLVSIFITCAAKDSNWRRTSSTFSENRFVISSNVIVAYNQW